MELLLLLILLSAISYLIVKRSVSQITQTPVWLLWLVLMAPPLLLTIWVSVVGEDEPLPLPLVLVPFIVCPLLYWWLIQKGRPAPPVTDKTATADDNELPTEAITNSTTTEPRPLTPDEETSLRNCFPWGIFYLQKLDYRPQAILCRGRLAAKPDVAYQTVREKVEEKFGDRFILIFQEGAANKPFFALVPNPWLKARAREQTEPVKRPLLALALAAITLFTTTVAGAEFAGIQPDQLQADPSVLLQGLPYSLALLTILSIHEFSHYFAAVRYQIRTTLPYFIPMPFFLGTFGAFIQMRSPIPNRRALFDIAWAGPMGGFIIALPLLLWGLANSTVVPLSDESSLVNFASLDPRFSLLLTIMARGALGAGFEQQMAINLHPVAIAGYLGLVVTALNLMPVGQLDGGHIVHAMFGQRTALAIGQIARLLMLVLAFVQREFLIWAIILLFIPVSDEPALNDVTELDNRRDFLGLLALGLLAAILLPLPGVVATWLGV
ncbi:MAG: site-2 protease family protein [Spirulinaceae cyanobacterium SM2_1_0]|nr:site-2 protease family protein [Spirulinaceae cyanobacterium SM2_1_0]